MFNPKMGEMIHFDEHIFFKWVASTTNYRHSCPILPVSWEPLLFSLNARASTPKDLTREVEIDGDDESALPMYHQAWRPDPGGS